MKNIIFKMEDNVILKRMFPKHQKNDIINILDDLKSTKDVVYYDTLDNGASFILNVKFKDVAAAFLLGFKIGLDTGRNEFCTDMVSIIQEYQKDPRLVCSISLGLAKAGI